MYIRGNKNIAGYCEILEIQPAIWLSRLEQRHDDFYFYFFLIYLFNWRLITLQYCSGFCGMVTFRTTQLCSNDNNKQ